jgi:translation initiation factor IF-3
LRINTEIRATEVRVVAEDGEQIGVLSTQEALEKARSINKDLVEIAPKAKPPVCKIIDYGKFKYQLTKKEKESKKAQHQVKVKEIKLRPNIDVHDLDTKKNRAKEFILKGNKVKIICMFRGREMLHINLGRNLLQKIILELQEISTVEAYPKLTGRNLTVVLAPLGKINKK